MAQPPQATQAEIPPAAPGVCKTTFAVVCGAPAIVNRLLAAKRSFGPLKFSQLDLSAMKRAGFSTDQPGDRFINLNELVPSQVIRLLNFTKKQLKDVGFKYIWSRNSTVFAKFNNDSLVQIINSPGCNLM